MITRQHAHKLRQMIVKASTSLTDEDALTAIELYDFWKTDSDYVRGDRRRDRDDGKLYRCEQDHRSQAGWEPHNVPALWTQIAEPGTIPVWKQPTGAQDAYMTGDKVHYPDEEGAIWESTVDSNVWQPGVYGWAELTN